MKFGLIFSNSGAFCEPDHLVPFVQKAEQVGIESLWTVEHVVVPKDYESAYPYSPSGKMPGGEEAPIPDPLAWLSFVAAVTTRVKLATGILILPQRHPFYVAKMLATIDRLSAGRAILGVGIGWLEEEFKSLGIPFASRAARTEEAIEALRSLWSDGPSEFHGEHFDWNPVESNPKPVQRPGVPIVIGGHTAASARRAARIGDGYFPGRADRLEDCLKALREECQRLGRAPEEIEITSGSLPTLDEAMRLRDLGVDRFLVPPPGFTREAVVPGLEKLGNELIQKLA